jgi:hypothetical protein
MTCPLPRQARPGMAKKLTARRVPGVSEDALLV